MTILRRSVFASTLASLRLRSARWVGACLLVPLLVACSASLFQGSATDNHGIAYFPIEQYVAHTTTSLETWYTLTLEGKRTLPSGGIQNFSRQYFTTDPACIHDLTAVLESPADIESFRNFNSSLTNKARAKICYTDKDPESPDLAAWSQLKKVGESYERKARPSQDKRYLNIDRPRVGTASGTIKLAANGTLTEATASAEDKLVEHAVTALTGLAETATAAIPVNALLTKRWDLSKNAQEVAKLLPEMNEENLTEKLSANTKLDISLKITIRQRVYVTVIDDTCKAATPTKSCLVEQRVQEAATPPKDEAGKIEFAGTVKLPESPKP